MRVIAAVLPVIAAAACGGTTNPNPSPVTGDAPGSGGGGGEALYGEPFTGGQFNLGPVDYEESAFHDACAPTTKYASSIQTVEGSLLAGLWSGIPNVAADCDACILVTTAMGKSALLRVVTYGDTTPNSIDVSPNAYAMLDSGEYPRTMTWQFARCGDTGPMLYEFQTGSSEYWTSLWVRDPRAPIAKVEVRSPNHASYVELDRGTDGTLTDNAGFGKGDFTLRLTAMDGQTVEQPIAWPAGGIAGQLVTGSANFH
jgi:expansin (peptidoglycan-binding protein)